MKLGQGRSRWRVAAGGDHLAQLALRTALLPDGESGVEQHTDALGSASASFLAGHVTGRCRRSVGLGGLGSEQPLMNA